MSWKERRQLLQDTYRAARPQHEELLNEKDVARIVGMSLSSIRRFRKLNIGPVFRKLGDSVRYRPSDVSAWIESCPSGGGGKGE